MERINWHAKLWSTHFPIKVMEKTVNSAVSLDLNLHHQWYSLHVCKSEISLKCVHIKIASPCITFHLCSDLSQIQAGCFTLLRDLVSLLKVVQISWFPVLYLKLNAYPAFFFSLILGRLWKPTFRQITASPAFSKMFKNKWWDPAFAEEGPVIFSHLFSVKYFGKLIWVLCTIATVTIFFLPFHSFSKEQ